MKKQFYKMFNFKGITAPITEKSNQNYDLKVKNKDKESAQRVIHYFGVGHSFKSIDIGSYFGYELDDNKEKKIPTRFKSLQKEFFDFEKELKTLLGDIRNINSHYVHTFDEINISKINPKIIQLLKESFELSCIESFTKEKEKKVEDYFASLKKYEKELVLFLNDKFYPNREYQENDRILYDTYTKSEAIEDLLFITIDEDFDQKLENGYPIFPTKKGKYLSHNACLFLLTMFLYKNEANKLVSKIKGFKKNDDNKSRSKRNIFTLFSKKFSSQDINSEENHLVKFRDIIQYLNHYPTAWNKELELDNKVPEMTNKLINTVVEMEIERLFPDGIALNGDRFVIFTKYELFESFYRGKKLKNKCIAAEFQQDEIDKFKDEIIERSPKLKDLYKKLKDIKWNPNSEGYEITKIKEKIKKEEIEPNLVLEKLKKRIETKQLITSYGRNQDRFMDFATRFLAEINYFGSGAQFKMYQFYTTDEQADYLEEKKKTLSKKEYDKLKYHQGKLTHYATYKNHLDVYPSWETPFVIQNNAVQIRIDLWNNNPKIISIQRGLMIYFLEDALYNKKGNAGKDLLDKYYRTHLQDFASGLDVLKTEKEISEEQKTSFSKLFPKRLLHHYLPAKQDNQEKTNSLQAILTNAEKQETRYSQLLKKSKELKIEEEFLKKNKGKQFKLRFLRKTWHIMYFKKSYLEQAETNGHHKQFHITKEEYNDFCRWMFACDEVPEYKNQLTLLFERKGFFSNETFQNLFEKGNSLENWYHKTKIKYQEWLQENEVSQKDNKYTLPNYEPLFANEMFYINLSHFISFLETEKKLTKDGEGKFVYQSANNIQYLIESYYYTRKLEAKEQKQNGKLFNDLRKTKLEDALLYELSLHYLGLDKDITDKTKNNVNIILTQSLKFNIKNKNNDPLYTLEIPFNKIDAYVELITHQKNQEKTHKSSFLENTISYLEKVRCDSDIKTIICKKPEDKCKTVKINTLTYDDLNKIKNHIINNSVKFTTIEMLLEEFYIINDKIKINKENRITYDEIKSLKQYFDTETRNKAFHFGIPKNPYLPMLKEIETKFITHEVAPLGVKEEKNLPRDISRVTEGFLNGLYHNFFDQKITEKYEKRKKAQTRYFNEVINRIQK